MHSCTQESDLTKYDVRTPPEWYITRPKALEFNRLMSRAEAYLLARCHLPSRGSYCAGVTKTMRRMETDCPARPRTSSSILCTERYFVIGGRHERTQSRGHNTIVLNMECIDEELLHIQTRSFWSTGKHTSGFSQYM